MKQVKACSLDLHLRSNKKTVGATVPEMARLIVESLNPLLEDKGAKILVTPEPVGPMNPDGFLFNLEVHDL